MSHRFIISLSLSHLDRNSTATAGRLCLCLANQSACENSSEVSKIEGMRMSHGFKSQTTYDMPPSRCPQEACAKLLCSYAPLQCNMPKLQCYELGFWYILVVAGSPNSLEALCGSASPIELMGGRCCDLRNSPTELCSSGQPSNATRASGGVTNSGGYQSMAVHPNRR